MRTTFLALLSIFFFSHLSAQETGFKFGMVIAKPIGKTADVSSIGIGADLAYFKPINTSGFSIGVTSGLRNYAGKTTEIIHNGQPTKYKYKDALYIPVSAAARYNISHRFFVGADVGYSISLAKEIKNGLYYRPRLGFYISDFVAVNASFVGLKVKDGNWQSVNLAIEYNL